MEEKNHCCSTDLTVLDWQLWSRAAVALHPGPLLCFYAVCPDNQLILMDVPLFGSAHTLSCARLLRLALPCWWWGH